MRTHTVRATDRAATPVRDITLRVGWVPREPAGQWLVRTDNGRPLGWIARNLDREWEVRVLAAAFRGTGPDDEGSTTDTVPLFLYLGTDRLRSMPISTTRRQDSAARDIVRWLVDRQAPAVGFGPSVDVGPEAVRLKTLREHLEPRQPVAA